MGRRSKRGEVNKDIENWFSDKKKVKGSKKQAN